MTTIVKFVQCQEKFELGVCILYHHSWVICAFVNKFANCFFVYTVNSFAKPVTVVSSCVYSVVL